YLFKGYAQANLEPELGLRTIQKGFELGASKGIANLLRAEVRAYQAQDTDDLDEAKLAVKDAVFARELLGDKNPAAIWVCLIAHMAKAGVHEHLGQEKQRREELDLAGEDAKALKPHTKLPEAVVYRWLYLRERDKAEEALPELRNA